MSSHPANKSRIYVTSAEILQLKSVGMDTVFAVTAPQGTTLSVPNPLEVPDGFRYKCADLSMCPHSCALLHLGH
jgi:E2F transcription factor CC-MB domain